MFRIPWAEHELNEEFFVNYMKELLDSMKRQILKHFGHVLGEPKNYCKPLCKTGSRIREELAEELVKVA